MGIYLNNSKISNFGYFKHILGLDVGQRIIYHSILSAIYFNDLKKKTIQEKIDE